MKKINTDCELLRKQILDMSIILGRRSSGFKRTMEEDEPSLSKRSKGENGEIYVIQNTQSMDMTEDMTEDILRERFQYLNSFPALFNKIFADSDNFTFCMKMIDTIEDIQKGKISEHDASEKIGTSLAEKYVYTKIPGFDKKKDLRPLD
jgi:hypothetical protein